MAEPVLPVLKESRIVAGTWLGVVSGAVERGALRVTHEGESLGGLDVTPAEGGDWMLRLPLPVERISDGVQSFLVSDGAAVIGRFALVAGEPLEADLRAEIDLLRAELDLLQRAFRRHCRETG